MSGHFSMHGAEAEEIVRRPGRHTAVRCVAMFLLALTTLIAQAAFAQQVKSQQPVDYEYSLGPGDKVRVTVFGQENMSGEFSVTGAGDISLPFVGKIRAGGLTVTELESAIVNMLRPDYLKNPRVSVEVLNYRPFDIIGEVRRPGSYPYRNGMTVLNAVAMAGGFTYRAREDEFYIQRANDPAGAKQEAGPNTTVMPGDLIEVRERFF